MAGVAVRLVGALDVRRVGPDAASAPRVARHRAGRRMDYADLTPERLAAAIAEEIDRPVDYLAVPTDGARRAAGLLAELL